MIWNLSILAIVLILLVLAVSRWKVHPFIALLLAALSLGGLMGLDGPSTVDGVLNGFSKTLKWIAIVVILGAFIGEILRETGGASRIAERIVKWAGEKRIPWAMGFTGYLVSIPVFVDVAYILLQPVTEALAARSKRPILVVGLALTSGLMVSHTLLPPTPGPLAVAALLGADIGRLLLINGFVGIFAMAGGVIWAAWAGKRFPLAYDQKLALREKPSHTQQDLARKIRGMDFLPILVPIFLMAAGPAFKDHPQAILQSVFATLSTPMIAVLCGAAIAWLQLYVAGMSAKGGELVEKAITHSALVIMITGAGGAFGYIIQESGIQDGLSEYFSDSGLSYVLPFLVAAALTTATGSITVSLIGTASIVAPLAASMPYSPEMMATLMGCGSFCVSHANASFFWLLNRLHEVPVDTLYKTFTLQSVIMGASGLLGVLILSLFGVA